MFLKIVKDTQIFSFIFLIFLILYFYIYTRIFLKLFLIIPIIIIPHEGVTSTQSIVSLARLALSGHVAIDPGVKVI